MNRHLNAGTKLLVELTSGDIFEGNYYSGNDEKITLNNVSQYPSGEKYNFLYNFYKMDIASIRPLKDDATTTNPENNCQSTSVSLCDEKFEQIKKLAYDHVYVTVVDSTFFEVIKQINLCESISVIGLGSNFGRSSKINVLAVGTKTKVFVFDIKLSGERAFDLGLREILESDDILKVIHNCKILSDCLFHSHKVTLRNVFDTQVADFMLSKKEEKEQSSLRTLSACLCFHMNLPHNILNIIKPSYKHLMQRPLSNEIKLTAALEAAYLYFLRNLLLQIIFKNFNSHVNDYLSSMRDAEPTEALHMIDNNSTDFFKNLNIG